MPRICLQFHSPVHDSPRVRQVAELFDLHPRSPRVGRFSVDVPALTEPWAIGAIVGPSGSGKTSIARRAFGERLCQPRPWPNAAAIIDGFGEAPLVTIIRALTAVGFSSPRGWLKAFAQLSTGEQFRCNLARALLAGADLVVFDEFTSSVDRTVARVSSAAVARLIRRQAESRPGAQGSEREANTSASTADRGTHRSSCLNPDPRATDFHPRRFVAVTCHRDILPWLAPDWVLDMETRSLSRRSIARPAIRLRVSRCGGDEWRLFRDHHYLSGSLHRSARCYLGCIGGRPAAFGAVLPFPHATRWGWREHRLVCLPQFQGIGIGSAMSEFVASLYRATGRPYFSTTSHPAMIHHRARSPLWRPTRRPRRVHAGGATSTAPFMLRSASTRRITAGFEYIGPPRPDAAQLLGLHLATRATGQKEIGPYAMRNCRVGLIHQRLEWAGDFPYVPAMATARFGAGC